MKRIMSVLLALAIVFGITGLIPTGIVPETKVQAALNTGGRATVNDELNAVPAPGEVVIDGEIGENEWDWSGRILSYGDLDYKEFYSSEIASMWDKDNFYMAFKFVDHTPMQTNYDPELEPSWTWRGDSIQLRTITDRTRGWITISYYEKKDTGSLYLTFPDENDTVGYVTEPGGSKLIKTTEVSGDPKSMCFDAEVKYKKWEDGKGYNVELKIPYKMIFLTGDGFKGGTSFNLGIETYWGDVTGQTNNEYSKFENGGGYTNTKGWKPVNLLPSGNIPMREYIHDAEKTAAGTIHIPVKVPKTAKKITLVLEDRFGKRVANAVSEYDVEGNIIEEGADYYIVDTLWNGTDLDGYMVAPGEYTVKGIWHEGITPYFDESAYNPGNPPWPDSTGNGSWGSDHHPPSGITAVGDKLIIGAPNAESGTGIFMIDNDGKKLWGIKRGGDLLASNDKYVYALPGNDFYYDTSITGNTYLMRLNAETGKFAPFVLNGAERDLQLLLNDILGFNENAIVPEVTGITANNSYVAIAMAKGNSKISTAAFTNYGEYVNIIDAETGVLQRRVAVNDTGAVAFAKTGELYAVSGKNIVEINPNTGKTVKLPITAKDGEEFGAMAVMNDGSIVVFEKGDRQLNVYNKNGELLYEIGKKGGRAIEGYWEEDGLTHQVKQITVDSRDQIWVVEEWNYPRRISVWSREGYVKDFLGNPGYMGAGGALHEDDPEKVYVGPNEMIVDRENHTYKMNRVLYVPDIAKGEAFPIDVIENGRVQHFRTDVGGKMNNFIFKTAAGSGATVLYRELEDGTFKPFWATGEVSSIISDFGYGKYVPAYDACVYRENKSIEQSDVLNEFAALNQSSQFVWNDYNYDGAITVSECEFVGYKTNHGPVCLSGWGNRITKDMEFVLTDRDDWNDHPTTMCRLTPDYFTEDGLPRYTLKSFKRLDLDKVPFYGENVLTDDGAIISVRTLGGGSTREYRNGIKAIDPETGEDLWWYLNQYPGVHGSHSSGVQKQGQVVGPIKCMGVVEAGVNNEREVFMLRGNMGNDFIITTDGYYVQTLFRDGRIPMLKLPDTYEAALGLDMSKFSENGEPFSGTLVKHSDGKVRLLSSTAGPSVIIVRVEGLDTIQDIEPFKLEITRAMIDEAIIYNNSDPIEVSAEESQEASRGYGIKKTEKPMTIDGSSGDWLDIPNDIAIEKEGVEEKGTATLAYDDENLYALFTISDKTPMVNGGIDMGTLFKTGDVCDIQISNTGNTGTAPIDGDMRIVMSSLDGEPVAVLMKQVTNGEKKTFLYSSPVMSRTFDYVGIIEDAEVAIVRDEANGAYVLEAKLPLASLGVTAENAKNITGDVGIVTSDEIGTANKARVYFYNKNTGLVSDMPSEAILVPNTWGKMYFTEN